ncbi:MAG: hypothetical protein HOP15_15810 [Planctomycetes bacterium]|nr:hypothetical protein [Planctomycetota bacterium]
MSAPRELHDKLCVRRLARLEDEGLRSLPDDFLGRWDLDGSGAVEPDELPQAARARLATD